MKYRQIVEGIFKSRPNRFIAYVDVAGKEEMVHVKNTGRCKELLVPGTTVYLEVADQPERKTKYDLIAVMKNGRLINMDSQMPNAGAYEWVLAGGLGFLPAKLKREVKYENSRFDLWYQKKDGNEGFVEVKGVTLEDNNVVRFPDAPTTRGLKHIKELEIARKEGYEATVLFVIQMNGVKWFEPNEETMPEFGQQLLEAKRAGVNILAVDCQVKPEEVQLDQQVDVVLHKQENIGDGAPILRERLLALQDVSYKEFHCKLIPTVEQEKVIGVRTPALRALAKEFKGTEQAKAFMKQLPHKYYEENNLHGAFIEQIQSYEELIQALDDFLPYVDNWATCDLMTPKALKKNLPKLYKQIQRWMESQHVYTIRFALKMLMNFYLDDQFAGEYLELAASVQSEEYYVNMMVAWLFATALAKQYEKTLPYLLEHRLEKWVHNKTIQKAVESFRITKEQKELLKTLKIK